VFVRKRCRSRCFTAAGVWCGVGAGVNDWSCVSDKRGAALHALWLQVCGVV